jgi:hypothetical protein
VEQLKQCLPIISARHPEAQILMQVDNSANHGAFAPDALIQTRLNLSDGFPKLSAADKIDFGDQTISFRDTVFLDKDGVEHAQTFLIRNERNEIIGHKGIRFILQERGLWRSASIKINTKTRVASQVKEMLLPEARQVLSEQPDFLNQKNWITETVENLGHLVIFGVKFHPELAAIEYFWGEAKRHTRGNCNYSLDGLRKTVPQALLSVSTATIRRQFAHVQRYMKAYRMDDLNLRQVEWAMRKFSSHRRVSSRTLSIQELERDFCSPSFFGDMPTFVYNKLLIT